MADFILRIWGDDESDLVAALLRLFCFGAAAGFFIGMALYWWLA